MGFYFYALWNPMLGCLSIGVPRRLPQEDSNTKVWQRLFVLYGPVFYSRTLLRELLTILKSELIRFRRASYYYKLLTSLSSFTSLTTLEAVPIVKDGLLDSKLMAKAS
jgi:hypothetical protein